MKEILNDQFWFDEIFPACKIIKQGRECQCEYGIFEYLQYFLYSDITFTDPSPHIDN